MRVQVNGREKDFAGSELTVAQLLQRENVESPDMVSVQVNGVVVDRGEYADTVVRDGDEVDFLYFMGGGA